VAGCRRASPRPLTVVEHGAAAAFAALTSGAYTPERGERVAILLCGANTDPSDL